MRLDVCGGLVLAVGSDSSLLRLRESSRQRASYKAKPEGPSTVQLHSCLFMSLTRLRSMKVIVCINLLLSQTPCFLFIQTRIAVLTLSPIVLHRAVHNKQWSSDFNNNISFMQRAVVNNKFILV